MRVLGLLLVVLLTGCQQKSPVTTDHAAAKRPVIKQTPPMRRTQPAHSKEWRVAVKSEKDGAPAGPLPTKFKEVVPVNEPLSRYGNPSTYEVNGQRYNVMTSATGYRTRGLASWYGTKFHDKRTSSGDDYDMYALTAAHKTLPLPTYLKVTNLSNGRVAIVKVNDRGPFHEGRVIDLSYAAAAKLGLFPKGTAPVEIEALSVPTPRGKAHQAHYYLQLGAFSSQALANAFRDKLAKLTPSTVFIERHNQYFVVRVGPFADKSMTDQLKAALQRQGVKGAFSLLQ